MIKNEGAFSKLMKEFGGEGTAEEEQTPQEIVDGDTKAQDRRDAEMTGAGKGAYKVSQAIGNAAGTGKIEGRLIQSEKRTVGSISTSGMCRSLHFSVESLIDFGVVYRAYTGASKGWLTVPIISVMAVLMQGLYLPNPFFVFN